KSECLSPTRQRGTRVSSLAGASGSMSSIDDVALFLLIAVAVAAAAGDRARALRRAGFDAERLDVLLAVHGPHASGRAGHDRPHAPPWPRGRGSSSPAEARPPTAPAIRGRAGRQRRTP